VYAEEIWRYYATWSDTNANPNPEKIILTLISTLDDSSDRQFSADKVLYIQRDL